MDIESFYSFLDTAGITPLCHKLIQTDRYPALRLILAFENAMCNDDEGFDYRKEGKFEETKFSDDVVGIFPDLIYKLKVSPEKVEQFWDVFHLIVRKYYQFVKSSEYFTVQDKLNFFKDQFRAIKVGTFLTAAFGDANFIALNTFLKDAITEFEGEIALSAKLNNDSTASPSEEEKNDLSGNKESEEGAGTSKSLTRSPGPKYLPFDKLFTDEKMIEPLIKYLKRDKIRILDDNGHWLGLTRRKTEIMGFIEALHKRTLIIFTTSREVGLAFAEKFHISISTRSFTIHTHTRKDLVNSYLKIIDAFLAEYNSHNPHHSS